MPSALAPATDVDPSPPTSGAPPSRRRTITPLAVSLLILLVAEVAVRVFASHLPPPQTWLTPEGQVKYSQIHSISRAGKTGGVVFLSSSVLDVGIDPTAFVSETRTPMTAYNASLSGANIEELRWWADRVVVPLLHPKIVVVGLSSREVNKNDPQAAKLAHQFFSSPTVSHLRGTEGVWQRLERYGDDVSYLFRYRKSLRNPDDVLHHNSLVQLQQRVFSSPQGQELALAFQPYRHGADFDTQFKTTFLKDWEVSQSILGELTGLLHDLSAAGARVVLVDVPVTQEYIGEHPHKAADYAAYQDALRALAARSNTEFVPGEIWDTSFFADPVHLNEAGARRLAARLADLLLPRSTPGGA